jgi:RNA polymerase sigma factor (sigma-70 family)
MFCGNRPEIGSSYLANMPGGYLPSPDPLLSPACSPVLEPRPRPAQWSDDLLHRFRTDYAALVGMAWRYLHDQDAAEEVVQEAFMRFAQCQCTPQQGCEGAYLRSIVLNLCRCRLRAAAVRERYAVLHAVTPFQPDEEVVRDEDRRRVRELLAELPDRQRAVLVMRYLLGMSERETAVALSVSTGSVKTHAFRGTTTLRGRLSA